VTFLPGGPASQIINLHFDANRSPDLDRVIRVTLTDITNAMPDRLDGFITIVDDDLPDLTIADVTVSETRSSVRVVISSTQSSPKPMTVRYTTTGGSATAGSDFTATTGVATFNRTASGYFVDIPILPDSTAEGDETFSLVLSDATNARIRRSAATVIILDDETPVLPSIVAASVTVSENVDTIARFRVGLSFPSTREVRFRAVTGSGTATSGADFVPLDRMFVIPAGATDIFVDVTLLNDVEYERPETFALTLSEAVEATIATPALNATIFDSDFLPDDPNAVTVAAENIQLPEGNAGSTPARFTVRLSRAASAAVTVAYSTADGSAVAPADYTPVAGTLTFAPGETVKTVDVLVNGDIEYESDERFTLVMIANTTGKVTSATCRIIDGDPPVDRRRSAGH
jgi:hypothetical protein